MKKLTIKYFLGIGLILISSCTNSDSVQNEERIDWLKDYAFCKCQLYGFGEELRGEIFEKDISLSVLVDIADAWSLEEKMDSLVAEYVTKIPRSEILDHQGKKPITFKCLEFLRSNELDEFIQSVGR